MMTSNASSPYSRTLGVLLTLLVAIQAQAASFEEGRAAYLAGDYGKAIDILLPLAEQGNPKAQVTVGIKFDIRFQLKARNALETLRPDFAFSAVNT